MILDAIKDVDGVYRVPRYFSGGQSNYFYGIDWGKEYRSQVKARRNSDGTITILEIQDGL